MLQVRNVCLARGAQMVVEDLSLSLPRGEITALIGPNGCGKSTLLHALAGLLTPARGEVLLEGVPVSRYRRRELARRLAILPQHPQAPEGLTVGQLVRQGRFCHTGLLGGFGAADEAAVERAIARTALNDKAHRALAALSGGERQRAWIAALLAQETEVLLMDEPTSFLDIGHQVEVMSLVMALAREGKTVVIALHDINHALAIASHLVVMQRGVVRFCGRPADVLAGNLLNEVFAVRGRVVPDGAGALFVADVAAE